MAKRTYTQVVLDVESQLKEIITLLKPLVVVEPPVVIPPVVLPPPATPPVTEPPVSGAFAHTRTRPFAPPPVVRPDLSRLVPPYDPKNIRGSFPQKGNAPGKWPGMPDMGSTGEREDIGPMVDDAALFLMGGDPADMLIWAETHGQVPVHFRIDGKMVDLTEYPKATCFWSASAAGVNETDAFYFKADPNNPIKPDTSHYPGCDYTAYLATGDLFYLEELQDAATFHLLNMNPGYREYDRGLIRADQTRGLAWGLRDVACAWLATPEDAPAAVLPKSYWKRILDNNRDRFLAEWVGKNGCHFVPIFNGGCIAPWQQDMLGFILGWMIWTGQFPDWKPIYDCHIRQAIDRTSGKSGYPRSQAIQYWPKAEGATDMASFAAMNGFKDTASGKLETTDASYVCYLRGNLKMAVLNGVPDSGECFVWLDPQCTYIPPKWAV